MKGGKEEEEEKRIEALLLPTRRLVRECIDDEQEGNLRASLSSSETTRVYQSPSRVGPPLPFSKFAP